MTTEFLFLLGLCLMILSPFLGLAGLIVTIASKKYRKYGIISIIISLMLLIIGLGTSITNINGCGGGGSFH